VCQQLRLLPRSKVATLRQITCTEQHTAHVSVHQQQMPQMQTAADTAGVCSHAAKLPPCSQRQATAAHTAKSSEHTAPAGCRICTQECGCKLVDLVGQQLRLLPRSKVAALQHT
jgi:BRCT domain type II-containing protein